MQRRRSSTPKANAGIGYSSKVDRKPWRSCWGTSACSFRLIIEHLPEAIFDDIATGLGTGLLRAYVCEGQVDSYGEEWCAGDEEANRQGKLSGRGWVRPQHHLFVFLSWKHLEFMLGRVLWLFTLHPPSGRVRVLLALKWQSLIFCFFKLKLYAWLQWRVL